MPKVQFKVAYILLFTREKRKKLEEEGAFSCVYSTEKLVLYISRTCMLHTHIIREREKRDVCARVLPFVHFYLPTAVTLFATEINQCVSIIATIFAFTTRLCMSLTASFTEVAW